MHTVLDVFYATRKMTSGELFFLFGFLNFHPFNGQRKLSSPTSKKVEPND